MAALFGATAIHSRSSRTYDPWEVTDNEGKTWRFVFDASIRATHRSGRRQLSTGDDTYKVEMNSPKLEYSEMHVHVDASKHTPQSLKNALSIMYSKEDILFKALNVDERRVERWCQKVREPMLEKIRRLPTNTTMDRLKREWYEGGDGSYEHYNWTRYYALNLHSVFYRGTLEWRCFESTLHAGKVRANITLALAISAQAINQKRTVMRKTEISENPAFTFRTFLLRLGLIGPEYKNVREHLLSNLPGDRAWRYDKSQYPSLQRETLLCLRLQHEPEPDGLPLPGRPGGGYRPSGGIPPRFPHEWRRVWRCHHPAGAGQLCGWRPLAHFRTGRAEPGPL